MGFFGAGDVPGSNMIGPVLHDEELFATRQVTCVGQARGPAWHCDLLAVSAQPSLCCTGALLCAHTYAEIRKQEKGAKAWQG